MLDKQIQQSSNQALQKAKRIFRAQKAGHSGTLDVLASGLLPICFGEATKVSQYLLKERKSYFSEFVFGITTRSGDLEGEVLSRNETSFLSEELVTEALKKFLGRIRQVPPMYSALKRNGIPLYKLARRGLDFPRKPREVEVYRFEMKGFSKEVAKFEIECSKGTYVRKLAEDLGAELGCGACVSSLRRERLGTYDVRRAHTIGDLQGIMDSEGWTGLEKLLLGSDSALENLPSVSVSFEESVKLEMGQHVPSLNNHPSGLLRLYDEKGKFFGVGEQIANGLLTSRRLIRDTPDPD